MNTQKKIMQTVATNVGGKRITLTRYEDEGVYIVRAYAKGRISMPIYKEAAYNAKDAWSAFRDFQLIASWG